METKHSLISIDKYYIFTIILVFGFFILLFNKLVLLLKSNRSIKSSNGIIKHKNLN